MPRPAPSRLTYVSVTAAVQRVGAVDGVPLRVLPMLTIRGTVRCTSWPGCRRAALVLVDDRVAVGLEAAAALDHELALDLRRVEARRGEERERRRVDGDRRRLDRRGLLLTSVPELVVEHDARS